MTVGSKTNQQYEFGAFEKERALAALQHFLSSTTSLRILTDIRPAHTRHNGKAIQVRNERWYTQSKHATSVVPDRPSNKQPSPLSQPPMRQDCFTELSVADRSAGVLDDLFAPELPAVHKQFELPFTGEAPPAKESEKRSHSSSPRRSSLIEEVALARLKCSLHHHGRVGLAGSGCMEAS